MLINTTTNHAICVSGFSQAMLTELRSIKTTLVKELGEVKRHVLELKEAAKRRPAGQLAPDLVDAADDLYVFDDEEYPGDVAGIQGEQFLEFGAIISEFAREFVILVIFIMT